MRDKNNSYLGKEKSNECMCSESCYREKYFTVEFD